MSQNYWDEVANLINKYDAKGNFEGDLINYLSDLYPEENQIAAQQEKEQQGQYDDEIGLTSYGPLIDHIIKDDTSFAKLLEEIKNFFENQNSAADTSLEDLM